MAERITKNDLMEYDNVPVRVAAQYLGITEQAVRWGIRSGKLPIGTVSGKKGTRCLIPPAKLIDWKEGMDVAEKIDAELKTISKLMEQGLITFDDILGLINSDRKPA
jgi:hypothetical protein